MFVDASAIIAILAADAGTDAFIDAVDGAPSVGRFTSVIAVWEAVAGLSRRLDVPLPVAQEKTLAFLTAAGIKVVPVTLDHLSLALDALDRYGRHRLPDSERGRALNLGDCFHYAVARAAGTSILHKDVGLALTDIPPASR